MIDRPSLLETPNLANKSTFIESPVPGESVDDCYAWDSLIRGDYDGTDLAEWEDGKHIQETLPAAQWDAMIHDITALSYQLSQVCNSLWEEMYCIIHGAQVGMSQEAITQLLSGAQTFTNKTISFDSNTMTNVASLNTAQTLTNKTISFDDNTLQNVASLNTAQTLTNKTIDKKDNIVKCSATVINTTPYTLTPTKEMNCIIDVASGVITLGSGPYQGYELPILAKQDCTISYIGAGGSTSDNLTSNQVTSYIWNGSAWIQNGVSIKPIFISTSGSVNPTSEANYVIDTASVTLTVQNGVYVGQKVWVTSNATGSQMWYTGINGNTLIGIQNGEIARMTWNGTYWFCEVIVMVTGKDAEGNSFQYGGGISVRSTPTTETFTEITTNGATLDPSDSVKYALNISATPASVALDSGIAFGQKVFIINKGNQACSVSYIDYSGAHTDLLDIGVNVTYTWNGTYWTSSLMLVGVELNKRYNFVTNTPYVINANMSHNPTSECNYIFSVSGAQLTLGDGKYIGHKVTFVCPVTKGAVKFTSSEGANSIEFIFINQTAEFIWNGTYWLHNKFGCGPVHLLTNEASSNVTAGNMYYQVKNGICTLCMYEIKFINAGTFHMSTQIPPNQVWQQVNATNHSYYAASYINWITTQTGRVTAGSNDTGVLFYWVFTYPVSDTWLEPNA